MRYTKPECLTTLKGARAIQTGTDPQNKPIHEVMDAVGLFSLTAAYEADE